MFLIRPAGANQNAKVGIGGGGSLPSGILLGMPVDGGGPPYTPLPWYGYWPGQETAFYGINDGSLWFEPGGAARAFAWEAINDSGRTADKIRVPLVNAIALASSARISVGVGGSGKDATSWSTPTAPLTVMAAGAGGEFHLGVTVVEIDLPSPVAAGARVVVRVEAGAGVPWTGISSWVTTAEPTIVNGPQMANAGQNLTGAWSSSGINIGMIGAGVQWHVTGSPVVRILAGGDSRSAGVPPVVDPTNTRRRSWMGGVNTAEAANGQRFSIASWAEGGYTFTQYCDRLEYLLDNAPATLKSMCDIIAIDALSWNSFPASPSMTADIRARLDTLRAKCLAVGLGFIVYCVTPPGADRQDAGRLTEYADWKVWLAATAYAVDMTTWIADPGAPTFLDPAKSADGVHVDSDTGEAFGAAHVNAWWTAIQAQGA